MSTGSTVKGFTQAVTGELPRSPAAPSPDEVSWLRPAGPLRWPRRPAAEASPPGTEAPSGDAGSGSRNYPVLDQPLRRRGHQLQEGHRQFQRFEP